MTFIFGGTSVYKHYGVSSPWREKVSFAADQLGRLDKAEKSLSFFKSSEPFLTVKYSRELSKIRRANSLTNRQKDLHTEEIKSLNDRLDALQELARIFRVMLDSPVSAEYYRTVNPRLEALERAIREARHVAQSASPIKRLVYEISDAIKSDNHDNMLYFDRCGLIGLENAVYIDDNSETVQMFIKAIERSIKMSQVKLDARNVDMSKIRGYLHDLDTLDLMNSSSR